MKKISTSLALVAVSFAFAQVQKGAVGINTEEPKATLDVVTKSGADKSFRVENTSNQETVTILNNGNVGIGSNDPTAKLDVVGTARVRTVPDGDSRTDKVMLVDDEGNLKKTDVVNFKGSKGDSGASMLSGNGEPAGSIGKDGDTYLDRDTGLVWSKGSGSWTSTGRSLKGAQGPKGERGERGERGVAGPAGSDNITADNGLTKSGTNIELGGTLSKATTINLSDNKLNFTGGITEFAANSYSPLVVNSTNVNGGGVFIHPNDRDKRIELDVTKEGNFRIWASGDKFYLKRENGNVGLGTNNPAAKLDINSTGDGAELLKFSTERPWVFKQEGTGEDTNLALVPGGTIRGFNVKNFAGNNMAKFYTARLPEGDIVTLVETTGRVGIGTATPQADVKLDVEGKVRSSELAGVGDRPVVADANGILKIGTAATSTTANNTVYDADGTLAGNRTITQNNHDLTFKTGTGAVNFDGNTKFKGASYVNVTKVNTTSYTVDSRKDTNGLDYYISVEETTSEVTINLPEPSQSVGRVLIISNSSSGNVALEVGGEQALSGTDNPSIAKDRAMWIVSNGKRWFNLINF